MQQDSFERFFQFTPRLWQGPFAGAGT
jgi:hypothetical protein